MPCFVYIQDLPLQPVFYPVSRRYRKKVFCYTFYISRSRMDVFLTFSLSISCMLDGFFPGRICFIIKLYSFCIPVFAGYVSPSRSQLQINGCSFAMCGWWLLHPRWIYACICSAEAPVHPHDNMARFHRPCSCIARTSSLVFLWKSSPSLSHSSNSSANCCCEIPAAYRCQSGNMMPAENSL